MKRAAFALFLMVATLGACARCPTDVVCYPSPVGFIAPEPILGRIAVVGEQLSLKMQLSQSSPLGGRCLETRDDPAVSGPQTLEVFDPNNATIDATYTWTGDPAGGFDVRFTPLIPGNYHVSLRSVTGGLQTQTDVAVGVDRSDAMPLSVGRSCPFTGRTTAGAIVCGEEVWRGGESVSTQGAVDQPVIGNAIWSIGPAVVDRWVDHGDTVSRVPASTQQSAPIFDTSATEDEVLLLTSALKLQRLRATTEGWEELSSVELGQDAGAPVGVQRMGSAAFVFERGQQSTSGPFVSPTNLRACSYSLGEEGQLARTATPCQTINGLLVASNAEEVWTLEEHGTTSVGVLRVNLLRLHRRSGDHLEVANTLYVPSSIAIAARSDSRVIHQSLRPETHDEEKEGWVLAREKEGLIVLERYAQEFAFHSADATTLWLDRDGETHYVPLTP